MQTHEANSRVNGSFALLPKVSEKARILIVCDDDSITKRLKIAFQEACLSSEVVQSMTAGCAFARSGRFQAVFTTPVLRDGSWRRLATLPASTI